MSEPHFEWVGPGATDDILGRLATEPCPRPDCDGVLHHDEYKDAAAVVCDACDVPAARLWGESA